MTASKFIKIMLALEMTVGEVNEMLDGRRPKIEELSEVAREMADNMDGTEPSESEISTYDKLLRIADGMENGHSVPKITKSTELIAALQSIRVDLEYLDDVAPLHIRHKSTLRCALDAVEKALLGI